MSGKGHGVTNCRGCGQEAIWIKTVKGKNVLCELPALRFGSAKAGHTYFSAEGFCVKVGYKGVDDDELVYECHWGNCPNADNFRK